MQINRVRTFTSDNYPLYDSSPTAYLLPSQYKEVRDVNNGRLRPLSPCVIRSVRTFPKYVPSTYVDFFGRPDRLALNIPPSLYLDHINGCVAETIREHESQLFSYLAKTRKKLVGDFSSLNFLYELRETGGLLLDIDGKMRKLSSYRPIDYLFGVAPLISDLNNALQHIGSIISKFALGDNKNNVIELSRRLNSHDIIPYRYISFFSGNGHEQEDDITVTSRIKGDLSLGVPWIKQIDPGVFRVLDALAIDFSPENAYNAIPFSWALDWVFPLGSFLSALPTGMKAEANFRGTISHTVKSLSKTKTLYSGPGYAMPDGKAGSTLIGSSYTRKPIDGDIASLLKMDFMGGVNSWARGLIARDILSANRPNTGVQKAFETLNKASK